VIEESPRDWKLQYHGASHPINQVNTGALVMGVLDDAIVGTLQRPCASNHVQSNDSSEKDLYEQHPTHCEGLCKVVDPVNIINMNIIGLLH